MPQLTIHFTAENLTKLKDRKISLMKNSVKGTITNSDAINDIMDDLN